MCCGKEKEEPAGGAALYLCLLWEMGTCLHLKSLRHVTVEPSVKVAFEASMSPK